MPEIGGGGFCSPVADGSLGHFSPTVDPCVCEGWPFVGGVVFVSDRGAVDTTVLLGEVVGVLGVVGLGLCREALSALGTILCAV